MKTAFSKLPAGSTRIFVSPLTVILCLLVCLFESLFAQEDKTARLLQRADSLLTLSKLQESEIVYRQVLVFDDHSLGAVKGLGKIALSRSDWPAFREWFEMALDLDPNDAEAKRFLTERSKVRRAVLQGDSLLNRGKIEAAEDAYKGALDMDPKYSDALKGLGKVAYEKEDWKDANRWFNEVLEVNPADLESRNFLVKSPKYDEAVMTADNYFAIEDFESAKKAYKEVLKMNKHSVHALKQLGRMALKEENWGDVKDAFNKVLKEAPMDVEAAYGLGIGYRETGKFKSLLLKRHDFNQSRKYFDLAIAQDSLYRDVFYQRALLAKLKEDWFDAVSWGHRQVTVKPDLAVSQSGLLKLYRTLMVHEDEKKIDEWLRSVPSDWAALIRAEKLRKEKAFAGADSLLVALLARQDLEICKVPVHLIYARSLAAQNREAEADAQFRNAIDATVTDADAAILFDFTKYILNDDEYAAYARLTRPEQRRIFLAAVWTSRNPTPAAPTNERALEHCRRLNHAEEAYWFDGVRSWANNPDKSGYLKYPKVYNLNDEFNDKGLVYIRHGEPDKFAKTSDRDLSNESWEYLPRPDRAKLIFHFVLEKQLAYGNNWRLTPVIANRFILQDRVGWDPKLDRLYFALSASADEANQGEINSLVAQLSDESKEVVDFAMSTDYHTWEKKVEPLDFPFFISTMRGFGNKTLVEAYFGIPLSELRENGNDVKFEQGAGIYNRNWEQITRSFEQVRLAPADTARVFKDYFLQKYEFYLPAGTYNLAMYAKTEDETKVGRQNVRATIQDFDRISFELSDPIVAYDISPVGQGSPFDKGDLTIIPNPARTFKVKEPVFIYYEIYNLKRDRDEETRYRVLNKMTLLKKSKGGFLGLFGSGGSKSISIENDRSGTKRDAVEYASFNVEKLEPGEYRLTIQVEDLIAKQTIEKNFDLILTK